jgi:hypothetical protein
MIAVAFANASFAGGAAVAACGAASVQMSTSAHSHVDLGLFIAILRSSSRRVRCGLALEVVALQRRSRPI